MSDLSKPFNGTLKMSDNIIILGGTRQRLFSGYLTDLNIWSKALETENLENFVNCGPMSEVPDLFHWENFKLLRIGSKVVEKNITKHDICEAEYGHERSLTFFDEKLTMQQSLRTCKTLNGELAGSDDIRNFCTKIMNKENRCKDGYWIPIIKKSGIEEEFVEVNLNKSYPYEIPWAEGQPNGESTQPCVSTDEYANSSTVVDIECNMKYCFACYLTSFQIFRVKGTCMDGLDIDTKYTLKSDPLINGQLMFQGMSGVSVIRKLQNSSTWALMNGANATLKVATIGTKSSSLFPIGVNKWIVSKDRGFCKDEVSFVNISLSKVF